MKINFELIKQIISILCTFTILGTFIVTELCTKTKSPTFIEYTDLFKTLLNLYIFFILLLCFFHSAYPKGVCKIFTDKIGIITTDRGKIIILSSIIIMYFSTESMPQKLFGMISFVAVLALFLADLLLNCDTLKQKPLINERIGTNKQIQASPVKVTNSENVANVINIPNENKN